MSYFVAHGLKRYLLDTDPDVDSKFKESENLEELFRLLNSAFDVMNYKRPIDGIRRENLVDRRKII